MTCDPHPDAVTLARWLDGELPGRQAGTLAAHLAACPACRAEVEAWQAIDTALAGPTSALPAGFVARTCSRAIDQSEFVTPLWWLTLPPAWRAGMAALLLAAAVAGWRLGGTLAPSPDPADSLLAALAAPELAAVELAAAHQTPRRQP
jgi:anti-sigma factor RsiW